MDGGLNEIDRVLLYRNNGILSSVMRNKIIFVNGGFISPLD